MRDKALTYLRTALGRTDADFRPGQWESIEAILNRRRLLVVERTGWGKSMVYFLATRLLRDGGTGVSLLISPLLSLMRNQLEGAQEELRRKSGRPVFVRLGDSVPMGNCKLIDLGAVAFPSVAGTRDPATLLKGAVCAKAPQEQESELSLFRQPTDDKQAVAMIRETPSVWGKAPTVHQLRMHDRMDDHVQSSR